MSAKKQFYAHGKLLLTGEYAVLNGATSLAIPTKFGQWLTIADATDTEQLEWNSIDQEGEKWFGVTFNLNLDVIKTTDSQIADRLKGILNQAVKQNPGFITELKGKLVTTKLEFNRNWGLGSSSTLISLISQWANIDPYVVLENTFKGSGYDIACASASTPILFTKEDTPRIDTVEFNPSCTENMFFVYLGKKQVSRTEIAKYANLKFNKKEFAETITQLTNSIVKADNLEQLQSLFNSHEQTVSKALGYPTIKSQFFDSISGTFKSLGAWGGDFVLFLGKEEELKKINNLGFPTILTWSEMILTA